MGAVSWLRKLDQRVFGTPGAGRRLTGRPAVVVALVVALLALLLSGLIVRREILSLSGLVVVMVLGAVVGTIIGRKIR